MPQTREQEHLPLSDLTTLLVPEAPIASGGHSEVVSCTQDAHPLARLAGKYNEEPLWDDFLQSMQDVRRQMNAQEEVQSENVG